jgi:tripartite ATP-independent transporter DctM subunit
MATILSSCGISARIYSGSAALFARLPGGLLHANIAGCALFASICGSTAATCAAMSTIALPELRQRGYEERMSLGSLAAGGTLGPMIPPSIAFIIYGVLTQTSIGELFMAGVVPGIMLGAAFMIYIILHSIITKDVRTEEKRSFKEAVLALLSIWPVVVLFVIVLGSIYMGICTAVEAGAIGCMGSLIVAAIFKELNGENLRKALREGTEITALIFFVLMGGMILGHSFSNYGIPQYLIKLVTYLNLSQYKFLILLSVMYLILGFFLDGAAVMVVTIPLIFPVVEAMGFNLLWFGVIMVLFTEIAAITPPVGCNLFVLQGITKKPIEEIVMGGIPFVVIIFLLEAVFVLWPEVVLFLPNSMH